ncbi:twin-arginine translocation signal domain-containing protein [Thalassobius vesicularis]|uniref:Twin-arginine translocation signal domain-containing protein n=1 Tax=Thalassobius vesicularis TaxID=1294297 RepID=A0A4S3ME63_9RHOB|nr:ABC transporter substrate-binding protein [Thalassobius vesicularis]THD76777.1 twin-arginine translocation signal domain-containing protein [Thalassobius vesicularis]
MTKHTLSRRGFMKATGATGLLAASGIASPAIAKTKKLKIGFVTPQTGPLAIFAEPDQFTLNQFAKKIGDGLMINGSKHEIEFIVKDSQSNSNRASSVAQELILGEEVDVICATSTPDTTNPVADQAELNGVPCLTNDTPWQPHFFGRQGDPAKGFQYTYHFFWGLEDIIGSFVNMWDKVDTNKVVGALWPNDPDGNGWAHPELGFPPVMTQRGYKLVDPGRYQNMSDDFSAQISAFKQAGVEIVTGVVIPPDFTTFWTQAAQQGFHPKVVNAAKATEFPQAVGALGDRADGLSVEVWWSPHHPFSSGFTGQTSAELAADYEAQTGNPWTMPLGFKHSLFEVIFDSLQRSEDPTDPDSIAAAIKATNYNSVVGNINFAGGPVPNIAKTPLVGGQWRLENGKPVLDIVENGAHPDIPLTGEMKAIG